METHNFLIDIVKKMNKPYSDILYDKSLFSYDIGFSAIEVALLLQLVSRFCSVNIIELYAMLKNKAVISYKTIDNIIMKIK